MRHICYRGSGQYACLATVQTEEWYNFKENTSDIQMQAFVSLLNALDLYTDKRGGGEMTSLG
jgi:hypothetical protein